ncbi:MAG: HAD-IIIA family hydrolase [Candidatus Omnitrophica bacterium]|nr:HAD-IIIA family hydrolase [Candidatus Omnitrophota bacterium]
MKINIEESVLSKVKKIRLLLLDVDGVLTDGRIIYDSRGRDSKFFDVHDGLGVYLLYKAGIKTILVTAKASRAILPRARDMRIEEVYADVSPKSLVLEKILKKYRLKADELCFVGDDLVDLPLLKRVGFPVAVFNACPEVKRAAHYITIRQGGRGAVREVAELILKGQGRWQELVGAYDI